LPVTRPNLGLAEAKSKAKMKDAAATIKRNMITHPKTPLRQAQIPYTD
jgi:hypothetical protein